MHCAAIEFARYVRGWEDANSTEFNPELISVMMFCRNSGDRELGGTMRLAFIPAILFRTLAAKFTSRKSS